MSQSTPEIDIEKLDTSSAQHATVIDVREPGEYVAGHVPGATLVPMGQLTSRLGELDRSRPVYVVCASGNRSAAMTDVLVANGFDAYSVVGGTAAWARSGRPVETGAPRRA
jgi:rhodanese-related sulfurtransferase